MFANDTKGHWKEHDLDEEIQLENVQIADNVLHHGNDVAEPFNNLH